jgi:hypothetical protein
MSQLITMHKREKNVENVIYFYDINNLLWQPTYLLWVEWPTWKRIELVIMNDERSAADNIEKVDTLLNTVCFMNVVHCSMVYASN